MSAQRSRGVVLVVYGERAERVAEGCLNSLQTAAMGRYVMPLLPVCVRRTRHPQLHLTDAQEARYAKATLLDWTPFRDTLYLDADTVVYDPDALWLGFTILDEGADLVLTPSQQQQAFWLWHVSEDERVATQEQIGAQPVQLQAGVFWVRRNARTIRLWRTWCVEWERWRGEDQAALLRALHQSPVRLWLLASAYNGGEAIGHRWGSIRRAD